MTSRRLENPILPVVEAYTHQIIKNVSINRIMTSNNSTVYRLSTIIGLGREKNGVIDQDGSTFKEYYVDVLEETLFVRRSFDELSDFIVEKYNEREEAIRLAQEARMIAENLVRERIDIGTTRI